MMHVIVYYIVISTGNQMCKSYTVPIVLVYKISSMLLVYLNEAHRHMQLCSLFILHWFNLCTLSTRHGRSESLRREAGQVT